MGVRAFEPDKAVKEEQAKSARQVFELQDLLPRAEEVSGGQLLFDTGAMIQRYLVVPDGSAAILAVWALHPYCYDWFAISPRLAITSAEKGSGKITL